MVTEITYRLLFESIGPPESFLSNGIVCWHMAFISRSMIGLINAIRYKIARVIECFNIKSPNILFNLLNNSNFDYLIYVARKIGDFR